MKTDPFLPALEGCDAVQWEISQDADAGTPLPPAIRAHVDGCENCARFAAQWLHGAPAELTRPPAAGPAADAALRERILHAAAAHRTAADIPTPDAAPTPLIIPFPAPRPGRPSWTAWAGQIAAGVAVAGFSYWLLNPRPAGPRIDPQPPVTLGQSLNQMEGRTKREQQVLHSALVDGGSQVTDNVQWSVSALDL